MNKKYYPEIDILKGIAILLVYLAHAVIKHPVNLHEVPITKNIFDWVEAIHMPLFFLVSGYCYRPIKIIESRGTKGIQVAWGGIESLLVKRFGGC